MTLPNPALPPDPQRQPPAFSSRKNELTHVSEVLAESGIPVAASLKERMAEELVRLIEEENIQGQRAAPRCSA